MDAFGSVDYPLHQRILNIQRIVLEHVFDRPCCRASRTTPCKADKDEKPLTIAEVFRGVTDGVWSDVPDKDGKEAKQPRVLVGDPPQLAARAPEEPVHLGAGQTTAER